MITGPQHVIVMGVSGSGKTTVALVLARRLDWPMLEGDDLHPAANLAKMAAGVALDEADRAPWLARLASWTSARHVVGQSTVLTCSALTRRSRDRLRGAAPGTTFLHLAVPGPVLALRVEGRDHFMPASLLASQLATLEPLGADEAGIVTDATGDVERVVDVVLTDLGLPIRG